MYTPLLYLTCPPCGVLCVSYPTKRDLFLVTPIVATSLHIKLTF